MCGLLAPRGPSCFGVPRGRVWGTMPRPMSQDIECPPARGDAGSGAEGPAGARPAGEGSPAARGPRAALRAFILGLVALAGGAEVAARVFDRSLEAASHRARFKAELLARGGPRDFVVVGTSRLNDGVAPADVQGASGTRHGSSPPGFNASVPSSSLATQVFLGRRALRQPGLRALFLEVSPQQLGALEDEGLEVDAAPQPRSFEEAALSASALVRHRRVLMVENLPRLWALARAPAHDGSEFFRTRWLLELVSGPRPASARMPPPERVCPGTSAEAPEAASELAGLAAWTELAQLAREQGVVPIFVAPPIAPSSRPVECSASGRRLWRALASRSGAVVLSWACAEVPGSWFSDGDHHLGPHGRAAFGEALGEAWAELLEGRGCEASL